MCLLYYVRCLLALSIRQINYYSVYPTRLSQNNILKPGVSLYINIYLLNLIDMNRVKKINIMSYD